MNKKHCFNSLHLNSIHFETTQMAFQFVLAEKHRSIFRWYHLPISSFCWHHWINCLLVPRVALKTLLYFSYEQSRLKLCLLRDTCQLTCELWKCRLVPRLKQHTYRWKESLINPGGKEANHCPSTSHFLAGTVFCRFHSLTVWSSEAVTRTGSTGWKARLRTESKWLLRVYFGFQVFLRASLLFWGKTGLQLHVVPKGGDNIEFM